MLSEEEWLLLAERQRLALTGMGRDRKGRDERNLLPVHLQHRRLPVFVELPGARDWQYGIESGLGRPVQRPLGALELHVPCCMRQLRRVKLCWGGGWLRAGRGAPPWAAARSPSKTRNARSPCGPSGATSASGPRAELAPRACRWPGGACRTSLRFPCRGIVASGSSSLCRRPASGVSPRRLCPAPPTIPEGSWRVARRPSLDLC